MCWRGKELVKAQSPPSPLSSHNDGSLTLSRQQPAKQSGWKCLVRLWDACTTLFFPPSLLLNSSLIFASTAVLVIPPCPEAASEKYYSQAGRGGQGRGGGERNCGKARRGGGDTVHSRTALWEGGGREMKRAEICWRRLRRSYNCTIYGSCPP